MEFGEVGWMKKKEIEARFFFFWFIGNFFSVGVKNGNLEK
jgi:hypothetical protein